MRCMICAEAMPKNRIGHTYCATCLEGLATVNQPTLQLVTGLLHRIEGLEMRLAQVEVVVHPDPDTKEREKVMSINKARKKYFDLGPVPWGEQRAPIDPEMQP